MFGLQNVSAFQLHSIPPSQLFLAIVRPNLDDVPDFHIGGVMDQLLTNYRTLNISHTSPTYSIRGF